MANSNLFIVVFCYIALLAKSLKRTKKFQCTIFKVVSSLIFMHCTVTQAHQCPRFGNPIQPNSQKARLVKVNFCRENMLLSHTKTLLQLIRSTDEKTGSEANYFSCGILKYLNNIDLNVKVQVRKIDNYVAIHNYNIYITNR